MNAWGVTGEKEDIRDTVGPATGNTGKGMSPEVSNLKVVTVHQVQGRQDMREGG